MGSGHIASAKRLIAAARKGSSRDTHSRGLCTDLSDCHPNKLERSKLGNCEIGSQGPLGRLLIRGEPGHDHIQALYPINDELVIDKAGYCAFRDTELLNRLKAIDVKEILIAGVTADVCVHSTMRSSSENGCINFYIRDAISTFDPEIESMERMVEVEGEYGVILQMLIRLKGFCIMLLCLFIQETGRTENIFTITG